MYAEERQQSILTQARASGRVEVVALSDELGVTVETVRRDLTALERLGLLRRVHGGAIPVERFELEPTLATRRTQYSDEKRRIAARALELIPDGSTVLFDAGTTTQAIVELLPAGLTLTVVTNSSNIGADLAGREGIDLYQLGGRVRPLTGAAVGEWTIAALQDLSVDVAFLGTNGLDLDRGLTTPDQAEAAVKRAMVAAARRTVVVTDASKVGQVHFHRFADLADVALLITDERLDDETATQIDNRGTDVVRA